MRRYFGMVCAAALLFLSACGGKVSGVEKSIGPSELYTDREIEEAMDVVLDTFRADFSGCTLTAIEYDEEETKREILGGQFGEVVMVLTSSFDVDASGGDGSLDPNSTCSGWKWVLVPTSQGGWGLVTWGYG